MQRRVYAGMISSMDDGVGKIISKLKEEKIYENTIIIFLSDNGGPNKNGRVDNFPFSGFKGSDLYEGGIRTPFLMQWPNKIKPKTKYSKPIISLDIFATMKSIINPELELPNEIHGKNILPYILGEKEGYPHKDLFWKYNGRFNIINNDTIKVPPRYAIRSGKYKMIIEEDETFLYDLNNDVSETNNLAELENAIVKELRQKIMSWDSKTMEPRFLGLMNNDLYNKLNPDRFKY